MRFSARSFSSAFKVARSWASTEGMGERRRVPLMGFMEHLRGAGEEEEEEEEGEGAMRRNRSGEDERREKSDAGRWK
jgi:hypothetical protein